MPTENEKQLTAMMILRDKLLEEVQNLKESAQENEHLKGYREALKNVANDIDAQMLATERQQLIDAYIDGGQDKVYYGNIAPETYYLETFKTK